MTKIITISREFGSGGREIGHRLSERLGIPFYDKQLIKMAAEDIDIEEHIFELYDDAFMEKEEIKYTPFSTVYEVPMSDQIFLQRELERTGVAMEDVKERYKIQKPETMSADLYRRVMEALSKTKSAGAA